MAEGVQERVGVLQEGSMEGGRGGVSPEVAGDIAIVRYHSA